MPKTKNENIILKIRKITAKYHLLIRERSNSSAIFLFICICISPYGIVDIQPAIVKIASLIV